MKPVRIFYTQIIKTLRISDTNLLIVLNDEDEVKGQLLTKEEVRNSGKEESTARRPYFHPSSSYKGEMQNRK